MADRTLLFDPGHVAFVHRNTFGNPDQPELSDATDVREPFGLLVTGDVPVDSRPGEDRDLWESLPKEFPLVRHLNAHAKADRNSLAIRRLWADVVTGQWPAPSSPSFSTRPVAAAWRTEIGWPIFRTSAG